MIGGSAFYLIAGVALLAFGLEPPFGLRLHNAAGLCFFAPIILFLSFVKVGQPGFVPSWKNAAWLTLIGSMPIIIPLCA